MNRGRIVTVTGAIEPAELGVTLIHEHVFIDISCYYRPPADLLGQRLTAEPLRMGMLGWVRQNSMSSRANLKLDDARVAAEELKIFADLGGKSLVDQTPIGIGRNPKGLQSIARRTGLQVIAGCGYYIGASHPPEVAGRTTGQLTEQFVRDVVEGIDGSGVRSGIIGEIGTSWPLQPDEEKVLRAAAGAQKQTGAPMSIHPGPSREAPGRIVAILREEGVDLHRILMSHIEARYRSLIDDYVSLAQTGCRLGFDTFGREQYFAALGRQHPQDDQRMDVIAELVRRGLAGSIMLSQDVCYRSDLCRYGGHGYGHILRNIVPRLDQRGVAHTDIETMMVVNPRDFLAFQ
jgi:phosphotriesterase-related protein